MPPSSPVPGVGTTAPLPSAPSAPPATYADTIQQPPVTTGQAAVQGGDLSQFGQAGQATGVADAICGPVAAAQFAQHFGRTPTIAEALELAKANGRWDAGTGMHGPAAEAALLTDMGVANRLEPNPSEGAVQRDIATGNPVILSSPGHYHYFVVTAYDPKTGLYDTGDTGTALKGGSRWRSWSDIGPQAALFIDEPTSPTPSTAADMSPQQGAPSVASGTTGGSIEQYVRQKAAQYGIDPDTAVAVANAEGGLNDWARQSDYVYKGKREESYGPFQLFMSGGLGNAFQQETGLDPRDPANGPAATDWALRYASQHGWADWHGAQRIGLDNMAGIGGKPSGVTPGGTPTGRANDSPFAPAEQPTDATTYGANQPADTPYDPWASVWDTLKGAQTEVQQIGQSAAATAAPIVGGAADAARGALGDVGQGVASDLSTVGHRFIDPNTYTQSAQRAGDVWQGAADTSAAINAAVAAPGNVLAPPGEGIYRHQAEPLRDPQLEQQAQDDAQRTIAQYERTNRPLTAAEKQSFLESSRAAINNAFLTFGNADAEAQGAARGLGIAGRAEDVRPIPEPAAPPTTGGRFGSLSGSEPLRPPDVAAPVAEAAAPARAGFAGRWNISKFPPALQAEMRRAYEADPAAFEAASRGVIPDARVEELARGVDIAPILDRWQPGTVLNAEETRAAQYAVAKAFDEARVAGAAPDSTEATQSFALAIQRAKASVGIGSEQGRAFRARRGSVEADALLNWQAASKGGVEDAFARVNGVHDQVQAAVNGLPEGQRAGAQAALDEAKAAAQDGYQAARNGVADHPNEGPVAPTDVPPAPPPEAAPAPASASEVTPTPERAPVDANGKPLTRRQQTALEREKIRQEFALARFGKRAEELTARQKQIVDGATAREAARQDRIGQSERLSADYKAQLEAQKQAAKDARTSYSERLKLERQREAAAQSYKAQQERARIAGENAQQRALRAAEDRHTQAMAKLFDAITDPARKNLVRQLAGTLGGNKSTLTPWQQAARAIRVAQRGRSIKPDQQQQLYKNLIKAVTGVDDPAVQASRMQKLREIVQSNDTLAMGRLLQEANQPGFWDNLMGYRAAGLLTGPATHLRNIVGNALSTASSPAERALAVPIDVGLSALKGRPRERFMGEIPRELAGWQHAFPEAWSRFSAIMKYGFDPNDLERLAGTRSENTIPIAKYPINTIFRGLGGMDAFFSHLSNQGEIRALAYRQARMEGLKGADLVQRTADLIDVPSVKIIQQAQKTARYRTFHQEMEGLGKGLNDLARAFPPFRLVMPFISTPYNIIKYDLERSPLGAMSIATDLAKGRYTPGSKRVLEHPEQLKEFGDLSDRIARLAIGITVLYGGSKLYASGELTGNGPTDPGQRDLWLRDHQPNSFRVGDHWVSWQNLPGVSTNLGMITGVLDAQQYGKGDALQQLAAGPEGALRAITQRSFLTGVADIAAAVSGPGGVGAAPGRYASSMAQSFLPASALLRRTAQGLDQQVKQPQGFAQQITQNIPGLSQGVQPNLDRSGQPILRDTRFAGLDFPGSALVGSLVNPATTDTALTDPTSLQAEAQGQPFPGTGNTLAGQSLTPEQQYRYEEVRGKLVTARRTALYASPAYKAADSVTQQKYADMADNAASAEARDQVMQEFGISSTKEGEPPRYDESKPWVQRLMQESNSADVGALARQISQAAGTPLKNRTPLQRKLAYYAQYSTPEWNTWSKAQKKQQGEMQGVVRGLATATP